MVTMADMKTRRDEILRVVAAHGGHDLRVFGSVARGDVTEGSDIDLLVRLNSDCSLIDHIALKHDLEDLLGQKVDLVTEDALHRLVRDRILKEAVAI
jgi:predicted nucleotidyltransferase